MTFEWKTIQTKGQKLHRSDHTANICGDHLYLFGGADIEEESTDELWVLDLSNFIYRHNENNISVDFKWRKLNPVAGEKPGKKMTHNKWN